MTYIKISLDKSEIPVYNKSKKKIPDIPQHEVILWKTTKRTI